MADGTKIEWADATWNPITGCSVVSPGCTNCYAMKLAGTRMKHHWSRAGLTDDTKGGPVWNGNVWFNERWLDQPLHWRKPRRIFVVAHGDLFHENVLDDWIDRVFAVMELAPQHKFIVLTKRSGRMRDYFGDIHARRAAIWTQIADIGSARDLGRPVGNFLPLPNVWLGVSVEDQARADERIPDLLDTPAAVRWVSAEPLLAAVNFWSDANYPLPSGGTGSAFDWGKGVNWVVAGGESGPNARPMHPDWARSIRDQCEAAGVPFFFKQWGEWAPQNTDFDPDCKYVAQDGEFVDEGDPGYCESAYMLRIGKKAAGAMLDGREHRDWPA